MTKPEGGWNRFAIVAEVHKRGMTLTGIAEDAGVYKSACRQGVIGQSRMGAELIAAALGIPFDELFPNHYLRGRHHRRQANRNTSRDGSANAPASSDKVRGAA